MITNDKLMVGDFVKDSESNRVLSIFALHELCAAGTDNIKQEYDMDYDNIMGLPLCDAILEIDTDGKIYLTLNAIRKVVCSSLTG